MEQSVFPRMKLDLSLLKDGRMAQTTMRVVLAEDNEIIRAGIRKILIKAQDIEVVGEAKNGAEALRPSMVSPDVLLLDVGCPSKQY
jgi:DNA-binding NarL/FixJ family response regulator